AAINAGRRGRMYDRTRAARPLLLVGVGPVLDIAFEHAVFEALLFVDRLGDVVERHDTQQGRAVDDRDVARMTLEHHPAQLHQVEAGSRGQRVVHLDIADLELAQLALPLRQRLQHLGEGKHAYHATVV